jgi:integrase
MAKKRGNQEGTIYQKANGRWRAQLMLNGGRLSITADTRSEVQDWLRSTRNQIENGLTFKGATISYDEFLNDWLIGAKSRLTEHTWRDYVQLIRDYVRPSLGRIRLRDLNASRIQSLYDQKVTEGKGLRTVHKIHAVIHASLNSAMKLGLLGRNPDDATQPPKPVRKDMRFLDTAEVKKLLETAKRIGNRNYGLCYLAVATGMRQGELLALRWEDINLDLGLLSVKLSLKRMPGGGLKLLQPKTRSSVRTIKLGNEAIEVLQVQKVKNGLDKTRAENLWHDLDFVFPSTVGTPMDPTNLLKAFRKLLLIAELPPIRFHDLRHTAASLMLNNGVDVLIASHRLGHAKPSITLDVYGHLIPSMQVHAAEVLEGLLSEK